MRVLIVEDNAFNAFCLRRLLEAVLKPVFVSIVANSRAALTLIESNSFDIVVLDGDLGEDSQANGPHLADFLLNQFPKLPVIAWSDSEAMRRDFAKVFQSHNQFMNEYNTWTKAISMDHICKTWAYYFNEFMAGQHSAFTKKATACINGG